MSSRIFLFFTVALLVACSNNKKVDETNEVATNELSTVVDENITTQFQNGDIIFQTSTSEQSKAIQLATHSKYSHVGILYYSEKKQDYFVFEAIQPVKETPLNEWIERGANKHYVVKRLIDRDNILTPKVLKSLKTFAKIYSGKDYDLYFEWNDNKIYCSELVWKMYKNAANIELGELQELGDFDLSDPLVKAKLTERYGENIPLNEKVISPSAIYNSDLLETIFEN